MSKRLPQQRKLSFFFIVVLLAMSMERSLGFIRHQTTSLEASTVGSSSKDTIKTSAIPKPFSRCCHNYCHYIDDSNDNEGTCFTTITTNQDNNFITSSITRHRQRVPLPTKKSGYISFQSTVLFTLTFFFSGCVFHPMAEASVWNSIDTPVSISTTTTLVAHAPPATISSITSSSHSSSLLLSNQQQELSQMLRSSSLHPATPQHPQIPLPLTWKNDFKDNMDTSKNNPQNLQALLQLSSPRIRSEVSLYGTDILIIQVWNGSPPPPPTTTTVSSSSTVAPADTDRMIGTSPVDNTRLLLGGAKISLGAMGSTFPLGISLGPQNAIAKDQWQQFTKLLPQDLWVQATLCRPLPQDEEQEEGDFTIFNHVDKNLDSKYTTSASSFQLSTTTACSPPGQYQPILQGTGIAKWIPLPSTDIGGTIHDDSNKDTTAAMNGEIMGIRAPATVLLQ